jgi:hypothetical protein
VSGFIERLEERLAGVRFELSIAEVEVEGLRPAYIAALGPFEEAESRRKAVSRIVDAIQQEIRILRAQEGFRTRGQE